VKLKPLLSQWTSALVALGLTCAPHAVATTTNSPSALPPLVTPAFVPPGGVYSTNVLLRIEAGTNEVRYTLDGSAPTTNSPRFTEPIQISRTSLVRVRAFNAGAAGPVVSQTYTLIHPGLADFSSGLPLLIINTFGRELSSESKVPAALRFVLPGANGRAKLTGAGDFDGRSTIRYRGYSSLRYPKKSFALDLKDESEKNLKASLLGFPADAEWILYAPYPDKTLIRDVLAYELSNNLGRYASRTRFIEVFFNPGAERLGESHYVGLYVLVEKIKRSPHRVNIAELDPEDDTEPAITGGYIFKKDHLEKVGLADGEPPPRAYARPNASLPTGPGGFPAHPSGFEERAAPPTTQLIGWRPAAGKLVATTNGFATAKGNSFFYVEPKPTAITAAQRAWLKAHLDRFESVLYGPDFRHPTNGYAAFLDVDSFIDYHLIVEATKNIDGFRFSTFFTKDRGGKLKIEPLWDWNLAFGNCRGKQGYLPQGWYWPQLDDYQYSWYRRLFDDPDFAQRYVDRWSQLRTNHLATAKLLARVDELAALLQEPAERNFKRWPILGESIVPNYYVGETYAQEIAWMKNWITTRLGWIDRQFLPLPAAVVQTGTNAPALNLVAAAGKIYFTTDGSDPRLPGGGLSPKAQFYQGPVPITGDISIFARVQQDHRWSGPIRARITAPQGALKPEA
jgi:hypothetical protein